MLSSAILVPLIASLAILSLVTLRLMILVVLTESVANSLVVTCEAPIAALSTELGA